MTAPLRSPVAWAIVAVVGVIAWLLFPGGRRPAPRPTQVAPTVTVPARATVPPTPTVTATPAPVPTLRPTAPNPAPTAIPSPTPSPTPWWDRPTVARRERPTPTPTPGREACVEIVGGASSSRAAPGQVLVELELRNRCRRGFAQTELFVEIVGWRDGSWVQAVRGRPFEDLEGRGHVTMTVALPGSLDWYDDITVHPFP